MMSKSIYDLRGRKRRAIATRIEHLADKLCKLIKWFLVAVIEFPCYSHNELADNIAKLGVDDPDALIESELSEYIKTSTSGRSKLRRLLITATSLVYAIKNLYVPLITVWSIDFKNIDVSGPNYEVISKNTIGLLCIKTNCTQFLLPGTGRTLDIRHFPLVPTCHPMINLIYPPTTYLGPYAMFLHAMVCFVVLQLGVILPLYQLMSPCKSDPLMFVIAPRLTIGLLGLRVKELYLEYNESFKSYLKAVEDRDTYRSLSPDRYLTLLTKRPHLSQVRHEIQLHFSGEMHNVSIKSEACLHKCWNELIWDCLPVVRTDWWRAHARRLIVIVFSISFSSLIYRVFVIAADVTRRTNLKAEELDWMKAEMYRTNCRSWFEVAPGVKFVAPPELYGINFNPSTLLDNVVVLILIMIIPCLAANYYLMDRELTCWRLELQDQLRIVCEITQIKQLEIASASSVCKNASKSTCLRHGMLSVRSLLSRKLGRESIFRQVFFACNEFTPLLNFRTRPMLRHDTASLVRRRIRCDRTELNGKIARQQLVLRALSELELSSDAFLNLLEKMYISFRLFIEHVHHCSDTTPPLTFATLGLSCGLVIIVVWHSRLMSEFSYEHMLVVVVTCLWTIMMNAMMSNFHAKVSSPQNAACERAHLAMKSHLSGLINNQRSN